MELHGINLAGVQTIMTAILHDIYTVSSLIPYIICLQTDKSNSCPVHNCCST
jgi:hypothetical protein